MPESMDPIEWLKEAAESAKRVRLAPGVLGKSSWLTYGVAIAWIVVLYRLSDNLVLDGLQLAGVILFTLYAMRETRKMRDYAVANPALALMEGADITEHQRFEAQAKGQLPVGTHLISTADPTRAPLIGHVQPGPES